MKRRSINSIELYANLPYTSHDTDQTREHQVAVRDFRWIPPLGLGMGIDAAISILAESTFEHVFTHFSLVLFIILWCWRRTTMNKVDIATIVSSSTAAARTAWRSLLLFSLAKAAAKKCYGIWRYGISAS